ncbi:beta-lactamase family protein [Paenibacillus sp. N3/727]|uniref:serine hydrolase domain-containing protein n=1 Tax=Paenibacillus sp. N3/727 TaxID=2925845 RepID=UPI001F52E549|nr:serine hydrolase domain-containing protein [Paenibacillus sp. N3/727]UNK18966.1 beta-lactamase family protein [Paenibacillus sp. N3/727]
MKITETISRVLLASLLLISIHTLLPAAQTDAQQDMNSSIDSYVESFLKEHRIPGASVILVRGQDTFYAKGWGVTGDSEEKVTPDTPFSLGSISKSLTGLAVMKLIEEGSVNLEDPVQTYLPWFTLQDKQAAAQITIKHLLTHASGLSTYTGLNISDKGAKDSDAIKNNVKSLSDVKLTASPGEIYQYSNANFLILGALIEEITDQTYSDYMEQQIFKPLGMTHTAADSDVAYEKGYEAGYQSWIGISHKSNIPYDNGGAPYGYIAASANDMAKYIQFLTKQQPGSILKEESIDQLYSPLLQTKKDRYYGFGWRITDDPVPSNKMIWHSGSTPDSHAEIFFFPETGWGGAILTNKNHILEETALLYLKKGIINLVNSEEPPTIPDNRPIIQLVLLGSVILLFMVTVFLIIKLRRGNVLRKRAWRLISALFLVLSVAIIPLLIFNTKSPWHAIQMFSPDVALLTSLICFLLACSGILSVFISFRTKFIYPQKTSV